MKGLVDIIGRGQPCDRPTGLISLELGLELERTGLLWSPCLQIHLFGVVFPHVGVFRLLALVLLFRVLQTERRVLYVSPPWQFLIIYQVVLFHICLIGSGAIQKIHV